MEPERFALGETAKIVNHGNPLYQGLDGVVKAGHTDKESGITYYRLLTPHGLIELAAGCLLKKGPG